MNLISGYRDRTKNLLSGRIEDLKGQRLFKDRLSVRIAIPTLLINALNIILLLLRVQPTDFAVPVRYSSLVGFDTLGPWYQVYAIGLFGLFTGVANIGMAIVVHPKSRITSFFLILGAFVVSLFCLIVSLAFTAIV